MSVTSNQSGSQTAAIGTEHTLGAAITTPGVYVLVVDTNAMANGDVLELRVYSKCKTGSTSRRARVGAGAGARGGAGGGGGPGPGGAGGAGARGRTAGTGRAGDGKSRSRE